MRTVSAEELAGRPDWVAIDGAVYSTEGFRHPGGRAVLLEAGGRDVSEAFRLYHPKGVLQRYRAQQVGVLEGAAAEEESRGYGAVEPFAEPYWYADGAKSPFYTASHETFRHRVRQFLDEHVIPHAHAWDEAGEFPEDLPRKAYDAGVFAAAWPTEYGGTPPEGFDTFHDLILIDELARCGCGGVLWSCFWSFGIALPPVLAAGSTALKNKVAKDVITGKKAMALAVTEPFGGSDVANLRTIARKEGDVYIVNGSKKFITAGVKADYYTVAVRIQDGSGSKGVSLLLMEKGMEGLRARRQKTQGWWASNTAFLTFDQVRVPCCNLIGKEHKAFKHIMENFNHERFLLGAMSNRFARLCIEDAVRYARLRQTFGKRLADHQVIRHKIAEMVRRVESTHAWLEQIAYQWKAKASVDLGGTIALCKVQCTKELEFCAREASQIMGGASYIRGGVGERVERIYREVRVAAIGGGSEEILMDLAMKRARL